VSVDLVLLLLSLSLNRSIRLAFLDLGFASPSMLHHIVYITVDVETYCYTNLASYIGYKTRHRYLFVFIIIEKITNTYLGFASPSVIKSFKAKRSPFFGRYSDKSESDISLTASSSICK
jgi:hypothetical protein